MKKVNVLNFTFYILIFSLFANTSYAKSFETNWSPYAKTLDIEDENISRFTQKWVTYDSNYTKPQDINVSKEPKNNFLFSFFKPDTNTIQDENISDEDTSIEFIKEIATKAYDYLKNKDYYFGINYNTLKLTEKPTYYGYNGLILTDNTESSNVKSFGFDIRTTIFNNFDLNFNYFKGNNDVEGKTFLVAKSLFLTYNFKIASANGFYSGISFTNIKATSSQTTDAFNVTYDSSSSSNYGLGIVLGYRYNIYTKYSVGLDYKHYFMDIDQNGLLVHDDETVYGTMNIVTTIKDNIALSLSFKF